MNVARGRENWKGGTHDDINNIADFFLLVGSAGHNIVISLIATVICCSIPLVIASDDHVLESTRNNVTTLDLCIS